jgi:hypothetical protein
VKQNIKNLEEKRKMYKPCPYCNKKKPHNHKGCNEPAEFRELITPIKKKPKEEK